MGLADVEFEELNREQCLWCEHQEVNATGKLECELDITPYRDQSKGCYRYLFCKPMFDRLQLDLRC